MDDKQRLRDIARNVRGYNQMIDSYQATIDDIKKQAEAKEDHSQLTADRVEKYQKEIAKAKQRVDELQKEASNLDPSGRDKPEISPGPVNQLSSRMESLGKKPAINGGNPLQSSQKAGAAPSQDDKDKWTPDHPQPVSKPPQSHHHESMQVVYKSISDKVGQAQQPANRTTAKGPGMGPGLLAPRNEKGEVIEDQGRNFFSKLTDSFGKLIDTILNKVNKPAHSTPSKPAQTTTTGPTTGTGTSSNSFTAWFQQVKQAILKPPAPSPPLAKTPPQSGTTPTPQPALTPPDPYSAFRPKSKKSSEPKEKERPDIHWGPGEIGNSMDLMSLSYDSKRTRHHADKLRKTSGHRTLEGIENLAQSGTEDNALGSMGKMASGLQKLTASIHPTVSAIAGVAAVGFQAADGLIKFSHTLHANNMKFAEFSGAMSAVAAKAEVREINLSRERGERRAETADRLAKINNWFDRDSAVMMDGIANKFNDTVGGLQGWGLYLKDQAKNIVKGNETEGLRGWVERKLKEEKDTEGETGEWIIDTMNDAYDPLTNRPKRFNN